jgi:tetratricopeptide (TPR) repeat protein
MREIMTRGVYLIVICVPIIILVLFSVLLFNYTSVPKNGLFIYATDIESLIEQGSTAYDLGRSEALQYFDQALAIDPDNVNALVNKGLALDDLDRSEEAIQYFDRALAIDAEDTDALVDKGLALDNLGRTEEAIQYYDRALAIDPSEVDAQNNKDSALLSLSSLAKRNQNTSVTN